MLDQRGQKDSQNRNLKSKKKPLGENTELVKRLETKPYGKRVDRGNELTFEKYLDGKANGKNMRKPRVPVFRKKDAANKQLLEANHKMNQDDPNYEFIMQNVKSFFFRKAEF